MANLYKLKKLTLTLDNEDFALVADITYGDELGANKTTTVCMTPDQIPDAVGIAVETLKAVSERHINE